MNVINESGLCKEKASTVAARRADKQKTSLSEYTRMLDKSPVHLFQCMAEESKYKGGGYGAKTGETRFRKTRVRGCLQASAVFVVELGSDSLASGAGVRHQKTKPPGGAKGDPVTYSHTCS